MKMSERKNDTDFTKTLFNCEVTRVLFSNSYSLINLVCKIVLLLLKTETK